MSMETNEKNIHFHKLTLEPTNWIRGLWTEARETNEGCIIIDNKKKRDREQVNFCGKQQPK